MNMTSHRLQNPISNDEHVAGNPAAKISLVQYGDYQCPNCIAAEPVIKKIIDDIGPDLCFVFRNFPQEDMHPFALQAAACAEAASLQGKFWEMHDRLYEAKGVLDMDSLFSYAQELGLDMRRMEDDLLNSRALAEKIEADVLGGERSGVEGTPSFFVNDILFESTWRDGTLEDHIRRLVSAPSRAYTPHP